MSFAAALWAMIKGAGLSLLGLLWDVLRARLRVPAWCLVALLAGAWIYAGHRETNARHAVQARWDAEVAAARARAAKQKSESDVRTARVETRVVERVRVVRERAAAIVKEVPIYVPVDSCPLSGGFRVLHDAAAAGVLPDPARIPLAAPVPAQAVAGTVAGNYATCQENDEAHLGLLAFGCANGWPVAPEVCARLEMPPKPAAIGDSP
jgi:hypothetical protein